MADYPADWSGLDVILAHDWLTGMRGGERVLELLCDGFDDARIYTLIHKSTAVSDVINSHPITTSALQRLPGVAGYYRYLLPFMPAAIERIRTRPADLLISTSHCVAKGLVPQSGTRHLCYCFTPMRYAWDFYEEYFGPNKIKRAALKPILARMREWDLRASERVDRFVAISNHVRGRIERHYKRAADVVYPPVDLDYYTPAEDGPRKDFDLVVSALVPYKRVDLAVRAYNLSGYPLKVVGVGTEMESLTALAADNVELMGWRSYEEIRELFRHCRQLIFPGEEDFGLVPVEAQACGRPVVAFAQGGLLETVRDGASGVFFETQSEDALISAAERAAAIDWDPAVIRSSALRFGIPQFIAGMDRNIRSLK